MFTPNKGNKGGKGIQLPVSHTLIDHHICHGVRPLGCHVKNGSFLHQACIACQWI